LRLIARAEQNTSGLRRKLEKHGYETTCINEVINRLCTLNLLDDRRFCKLWLESRLRLPRSPRRLLIALKTRGIDRDDAEAALKEVLDEETEYTLLLRFIKKYAKKTKAQNWKFFLKNEGFSSTVIKRYLEALD
jgi:regulatory protein